MGGAGLEGDVGEGVVIRCLHHDWFYTGDVGIALLHLAVDHLHGRASESEIRREAARLLRPEGRALMLEGRCQGS